MQSGEYRFPSYAISYLLIEISLSQRGFCMNKRLIALLFLFSLLFTAAFYACGAESTGGDESAADSDTIDFVSADNDSEPSSDNSIAEGDTFVPAVRPEGYPTVCGSFMQPSAFAGYSVERMKEHLQYMYDVGIDTVILQWSFETEGEKVKGAYFNSDFDSADKASAFNESGKGMLGALLEAAEDTGVRVFIGLNDSAEWWQKGVFDREWLTRQAELGIAGARQIYSEYSEKYPNAFYGWYFVFELYNMQASESIIDNAAYLLNLYRDGLADIDADMPMMLSPFIMSSGADPEETGELWESLFAKVNFKNGDIFCCQDSVGAGHIGIDELDAYYREIKEAVDTKAGLRFWANNEDFTQESWSTAPLDRFVEQLRITSEYVEEHVTFAYSHYQNPDVGKTGYHLAYKAYFETGSLPENEFEAPTAKYTSLQNGAIVRINGSIANPNGTVAGIYISKNGEYVTYIDLSGSYGEQEYTFTYTDTNISKKGLMKYSVCAVDYCGRYGEAFEFSVKVVSRGVRNVALGKTYVATKPESSYPDESGGSVTDGSRADGAFNDAAWCGYLTPPEFVIDLEESRQIITVEVSTLGGGYADIYAPSRITVSVSDNGTDFTQIAAVDFDPDSGSDSQNVIVRSVILDSTATARYVRISVSGTKGWTFIDEITVYGA